MLLPIVLSKKSGPRGNRGADADGKESASILESNMACMSVTIEYSRATQFITAMRRRAIRVYIAYAALGVANAERQNCGWRQACIALEHASA